MDELNKLQEVGERAGQGVLQGLVNQGPLATIGTAYALLGPDKLRQLAYGKPIVENTPQEIVKNQKRVFSVLSDLGDAHIRSGGKYPLRESGAPNIRVSVEPKKRPMYIPEHWDKKRKVWEAAGISLPSNAPEQTIAHEMGHVSPRTRLGRLVRNAAALTNKKGVFYAPLALALAGSVPELENVSKAAPYLGAGILATILGNEAAANIRGSKLLELAGRKMPIHKKLRMFIPTTSYLGHAATLIGLPYGINKGIEAYTKAKQNNQPLKFKETLRSTPTDVSNLPTYEEFVQQWGPVLNQKEK